MARRPSTRGRFATGERTTWHDPSMESDLRDDLGLIVVDHGSRREASNEAHERLVAMVATVVPYSIVEAAHMEIAEPSIATAFDRCVARGAREIIVSPYFLHPGRHWSTDIPTLVAEASAKHPGVPFMVAAPLGLHPLMAEVVAARIEHCRARVAGEGPPCDACVDGGGCTAQVGGPAS